MSHNLFDASELLYKVVSDRWRGLAAPAFVRKFRQDVMELEEATAVKTHNIGLPNHGASTVYELHNGLVVLCSQAERWSLYESRTRVESRENLAAWADFARGTWSDQCPREVGVYFTRDRETGRRGVRELIRREGRLLDISGGYVSTGLTTTWRGDWFLPRIPRLLGSY